jgi:hypothetical protein
VKNIKFAISFIHSLLIHHLFDIRYELKREIEATTSLKCCVIYGNLPVRACFWTCACVLDVCFGREFGCVFEGLGGLRLGTETFAKMLPSRAANKTRSTQPVYLMFESRSESRF